MKNAGGFLVGAGIALLAGYGIWRATRIKTFEKDENNVVPKPPVGNGSGSDNNGGPTIPPTTVEISYSGKKVADILKTVSQSKLVGRQIYSNGDNVQVYDSVNMPYTKAARGQLLGTFAGAVVSPQGGYMVNIRTNDPRNPYVKAYDAFLKF